jgi:hypothetical protein
MRKTHSLIRFVGLRSWWLKPLVALLAVSFVPVMTHAQTTLGTQTLTLIAEPDALLYSLPSSITLSKAGTNFNHEAATVTIQYRARTTASSGTGSITVEATSDFVCVGGGSCTSAPSASSGALVYTCTGATLGSGCAGTQTISTGGATNVVSAIPAASCTGGGSPCTTADPNTVTMNFSLTDDPKYKTGAYTATLTFTISAT